MSEQSFAEQIALANAERARMEAADSLRLTWEAQQVHEDVVADAARLEEQQ